MFCGEAWTTAVFAVCLSVVHTTAVRLSGAWTCHVGGTCHLRGRRQRQEQRRGCAKGAQLSRGTLLSYAYVQDYSTFSTLANENKHQPPPRGIHDGSPLRTYRVMTLHCRAPGVLLRPTAAGTRTSPNSHLNNSASPPTLHDAQHSVSKLCKIVPSADNASREGAEFAAKTGNTQDAASSAGSDAGIGWQALAVVTAPVSHLFGVLGGMPGWFSDAVFEVSSLSLLSRLRSVYGQPISA